MKILSIKQLNPFCHPPMNHFIHKEKVVHGKKKRGPIGNKTIAEEEDSNSEQETTTMEVDNKKKDIWNFDKYCVPVTLSVPQKIIPPVSQQGKTMEEEKTSSAPIVSSTPPPTSECGESLKKAVENKESSDGTEIYLFQLPSILPMEKITSEKEATGKDHRYCACTLAQCGNGRIGKLQIRKSGKMELVLGSDKHNDKPFVLNVNQSCKYDCHQQVMAFKAQHTTDLNEIFTTCTVLGDCPSDHFFVCSYQPDQLL